MPLQHVLKVHIYLKCPLLYLHGHIWDFQCATKYTENNCWRPYNTAYDWSLSLKGKLCDDAVEMARIKYKENGMNVKASETVCCRLKASTVTCGNLVPREMAWGGGAPGRQLGHENGSSWTWLVPLYKRLQRDPSHPPPCEVTAIGLVWGSGLSKNTESAGVMTLGFPASRTVRKKCLLFYKPLSLW